MGRAFIGRGAELQALCSALRAGAIGASSSAPRCVLLEGESGIGKTTLALAASDYARQRRAFGDGVGYIDVRRVLGQLHASRVAERRNVAAACSLGDEDTGHASTSLLARYCALRQRQCEADVLLTLVRAVAASIFVGGDGEAGNFIVDGGESKLSDNKGV